MPGVRWTPAVQALCDQAALWKRLDWWGGRGSSGPVCCSGSREEGSDWVVWLPLPRVTFSAAEVPDWGRAVKMTGKTKFDFFNQMLLIF